jgi:alanine dehydrogenase
MRSLPAMRIGVPREIKDGERRVGVVPDGVRALVADGHDVLLQRAAGAAAGFDDGDYARAGATIVADASAAWACELVVKVKELQPPEFALLSRGATIIGYAQLTRDPDLVAVLLAAGVRVIACERVRDASGALPLLAPMSRIAGRLAPFAGAAALGTDRGGAGVLLPGVDDVAPAWVVVIGAGTSGGEATRVAARIGCRVTVFSRGAQRLTALATDLAQEGTPIDAQTLDQAGAERFAAAIAAADLVIGAVLEPGMLSPQLVTRAHLRSMRAGSALVDIGIDQGGIAETSRMTSISDPTYVEERIVHYAVPNMPALVARTATVAYAAVTLPYVRRLAGRGIGRALRDDAGLACGVAVWDGAIVDAALAATLALPAVRSPWQ